MQAIQQRQQAIKEAETDADANCILTWGIGCMFTPVVALVAALMLGGATGSVEVALGTGVVAAIIVFCYITS